MEATPKPQYPRPIRILICNRYTLFREGLKALLREGIPMEIAGEAATASEAVELLKRIKPDVVLLDATTPDSPGARTVRRMKAIDPHAKILILSINDDEPIVASCLNAGAFGRVGKDEDAFNLKLTINRACGRNVRAAQARIC